MIKKEVVSRMQSSRKGKGRLFLVGVFSAMIVVLLLLGGCGGGSSNGGSDVPSPSPSPSPNPGTKWTWEDLRGKWVGRDGAGTVVEEGVRHSVEKVRVDVVFQQASDFVVSPSSFLELYYGVEFLSYEKDIIELLPQPAPDVLVLKLKEQSKVKDGINYRTSGTMTFRFVDRNTVRFREENTGCMFNDRADSRVERLEYTLKRQSPPTWDSSDLIIGY